MVWGQGDRQDSNNWRKVRVRGWRLQSSKPLTWRSWCVPEGFSAGYGVRATVFKDHSTEDWSFTKETPVDFEGPFPTMFKSIPMCSVHRGGKNIPSRPPLNKNIWESPTHEAKAHKAYPTLRLQQEDWEMSRKPWEISPPPPWACT